MRTDFDAIVVGSGFGGAVAAARLTQAGFSVVVLERGRRWTPGDFPRSSTLDADWLWSDGSGGTSAEASAAHGLYDLRWLDRMLSVQSAGWGGGSLVYANVFARPGDDAFEGPAWPDWYSRDALDPYYELASHMLEVQPVAADPATGRIPRRTLEMEALATGMRRAAGTVRPNLAVRFGDPETWSPNRHGIPQRGCSFCGECVIGCNRGAKHSLDFNYLAVAERGGANVRTSAEVVRLERVDGEGYLVTYRDHADGCLERHVTAPQVFLAAGAVGTTELLLRQRDVLGTLPALSPRLGEGFSGNGDALALVHGSRTRLDADRAPTITTTTVVDATESGERVRFQVQDGAIPRPLADLVARTIVEAIPGAARARALVGRLRRPRARESERSAGAPMALLMMGRDASAGRLRLDRRGRATVDWDNCASARLYRAEGRIGRAVAAGLRARVTASPLWSFLRVPVTVHNLGGVPMGATRDEGVIAADGVVHCYPGLHVVDGAAVPAATGANPSATILAMAERNVEQAIRRRLDDPGWHAPERADVLPKAVPEDAAVAAMAARLADRQGDGIRFAERLTGTIEVDRRPRRVELSLAVSTAGLDRFDADPRHPLELSGTIRIDGVATDRAVTGRLHVFPDGAAELMRYSLAFDGDDGRPHTATGVKVARRFGLLGIWPALTRLRLEVATAGDAPVHDGTRIARGSRGVLRITPLGVLALTASVRGEAFSRGRRAGAVVRFAGFFARGAARSPRRLAPWRTATV